MSELPESMPLEEGVEHYLRQLCEPLDEIENRISNRLIIKNAIAYGQNLGLQEALEMFKKA